MRIQTLSEARVEIACLRADNVRLNRELRAQRDLHRKLYRAFYGAFLAAKWPEGAKAR
jgi:hypothetical protein